MDAEEVMQAGERIWNLQRLYNLREGERRKDSIFPKRFYKDPLPEGPAKGMVMDAEKVERMLDDYYEARGWNRKDGIPTPEKMAELGLEEDLSDLDLTDAQQPEQVPLKSVQ
jgi:aldehyde:ferredoxin oxidoreductase